MAQYRFGRNYELTIEVGPDAEQAVVIRPPIRVAFSADKSIAGGLNRINLTIYNLKESTRRKLAKDPEDDVFIHLAFKVGYADVLEPIFRGTIYRGVNRRDGAEILTDIECQDGGFDYQFSETDRTVGPDSDTVREVLKDMPNTDPGAIAERQRLLRPRVMSGRSPRVLDGLVDDSENWFIDNERLHIIGENQVLGGGIPIVSAGTGLLGAPEREQREVTVNTRFNPAVRVGGQFKLESEIAPYMNGIYKARTITYDGDWEGDAWDQTITGIPPSLQPEVVDE